MLNLGLPEVRDYLIGIINSLIEEYGVSYFKMDMNRSVIQEFYSVGQPADQQQTWAVRYAQNLCEIYRAVKKKHPEVLIENCVSGGRRVDFAMAEFSGRINRSDNQDPVDELKLHEGFSMFMLPKFAGGATAAYPKYVFLDEEVALEAADLYTVLQNYMQAETAKFVTGLRSLEEFPQYLKELDAMGLQEYLGYYADYYAKYAQN